MATTQSQHQSLVESFEEFYQRYYTEEIGELARLYPQDKRSLFIEYSDLFQYSPDLADDWERQPDALQDAAEDALQQYDLPIDIGLGHAHVRLTDREGMLERTRVGDLAASHIGQYVAVYGHLEKVTGTKYRALEAVFVCQRCGGEQAVRQHLGDWQEPYQCEDCERQGPFQLDDEKSEFVDLRKLKVTELPEDQAGMHGEDVTVFVQDDLCWSGGENGLPDKAGQEVVVLGQYQLDDSGSGSNGDGEFQGWLTAQAVVFPDDSESDIDISEHQDEFEDYASRDDAVDLVRESIAPSIDPDTDVEVALEGAVAWLFGSYRVDQQEGAFRGDIHMGWIGDPGKGKSTIASRLDDLAPNSEYRSGTALTKVGLTASAVQEEFAGKTEWTLRPGILPRADGGHCIIDEVDAVMDEQTKSLHDALEGDQLLKVDKAGIRADLPTRTSLLALGNPVHGRFDRYEPVAEQVDLDDALIDRMDLLFSLTDEVDAERDRSKADHILGSYRELSEEEARERGMNVTPRDRETVQQPVPDDVLRAWLQYAREEVHPVLTDAAEERLREFYVEVRDLNGGHSDDGEEDAAIPATPRKLEAGIRIATAFARATLSETVEEAHAERAITVSKHVIGLNYDPESGEFDAGRTDSGTPNSQRDRVKQLLDIVDEVDSEFEDHRGAPVEEVLDRAGETGIGRSNAEHEIDQLMHKGELYEPKNGEVQTT